MGERRRTKHFVGNFVGLEYGMTQSPAWQHANGDSIKLLIDVCSRVSHRDPNNGQISYSTREAQKLLRCGSDKATRCFRQLVDLGFLAVERRGAFSVKLKLATTWRITFLPTQTGPATREYQRWRPEASAPRTGAENLSNSKKNTAPTLRVNSTQNRCRETENAPQNGFSAPKTGAVNADIRPVTAPRIGAPLDLAIGTGIERTIGHCPNPCPIGPKTKIGPTPRRIGVYPWEA
jgi:hypothetical protein